MRDSVRAAFIPWTTGFESWVDWFYLDVKGLLTVGLGLLATPATIHALRYTIGGAPANDVQVQAAIAYVNSRKDLALGGGGQYARLPQNSVRATHESIEAQVLAELAEGEEDLRHYFPGWDTFPADAQLGILSKVWADGPHFPPHWPHFTAAVNAGQWDVAAKECVPGPEEMGRQNKSFHDRIAAEVVLFSNAAVVVAQEIDPEPLQYPTVLAA